MDKPATRTCCQCQEEFPLDEWHFCKDKSQPGGFTYDCRPCHRKGTSTWKNSGSEKAVAYQKRRTETKRLHQYGLTHESYNALLTEQNFCCGSCERHISEFKERFHVDHDHKCCPGEKSCGKCIRGLLCRGCNLAAGNLQDDPERAERLARYLRTAMESRVSM